MLAKWVFTVAYVFAGGSAQDLPILLQTTERIPEIRQRIAEATWYAEPCPPVPAGVVAPPCSPVPQVSSGFQLFCTAPGVWTFTVRLGLVAQEPLGGKVWMTLADGSEVLLAAFNAAPGTPAYVGASLQAQSLFYDSCYRIRVESNRPVEVMGDPRVSFVTIGS